LVDRQGGQTVPKTRLWLRGHHASPAAGARRQRGMGRFAEDREKPGPETGRRHYWWRLGPGREECCLDQIIRTTRIAHQQPRIGSKRREKCQDFAADIRRLCRDVRRMGLRSEAGRRRADGHDFPQRPGRESGATRCQTPPCCSCAKPALMQISRRG